MRIIKTEIVSACLLVTVTPNRFHALPGNTCLDCRPLPRCIDKVNVSIEFPDDNPFGNIFTGIDTYPMDWRDIKVGFYFKHGYDPASAGRKDSSADRGSSAPERKNHSCHKLGDSSQGFPHGGLYPAWLFLYSHRQN